MPTRPVHMAPPGFEEQNTAGPHAPSSDESSPAPADAFMPRTLEKARAELTFDVPPSLADAPAPATAGSSALSVSVAFDAEAYAPASVPPCAPPLHEPTIERTPAVARPRRWIRWPMLVLSAAACAAVLATPGNVGTGATAHLAAVLASSATKALSAARALVEAPRSTKPGTADAPAAAHDDVAPPARMPVEAMGNATALPEPPPGESER